MGSRGFPQDPRGPRPHSGGQRGRVRGTSQALEECELPDRRKEGTGCDPGPPLGLGKAAKLPRQEAGWGRAEAAAARAQLGAAGEPLGQRLRWVGGPPRLGGWEPGGHAAGRAAGAPRDSGWAGSPARKLRREPEPERSQSSDIRAPANTCERPPGPAGGARSPGRGRAGGGATGLGSGPRGRGSAPARLRAALRAEWLSSRWAGSGQRAP